MHLHYRPLLALQREIQGRPRNYARFEHYLRSIFNHGGPEGERIPLLLANPMAKDHVTTLLDDLLAIDADAIAGIAAAEASERLADPPEDYPAALVVVDDLKGGWTNRAAVEFELRFGPAHAKERIGPPHIQQTWIFGAIWSSEPASERVAREAILKPAFRMAYVHRSGPAKTLRQRLAQEGWVMAASGCEGPTLEPDDLEYSREIIAPFLDADDMRTTVECLFGDDAARSLGFTPRGLSSWAGLALALHDAKALSNRLIPSAAAQG
jgi:hypothetical protein